MTKKYKHHFRNLGLVLFVLLVMWAIPAGGLLTDESSDSNETVEEEIPEYTTNIDGSRVLVSSASETEETEDTDTCDAITRDWSEHRQGSDYCYQNPEGSSYICSETRC